MTAIATPTASERRGRGGRRVPIVADDACTTPELCASVRAFARGTPIEALVIAPAHGTAATQWYVDEDAARADATHRLRTCVSCLIRDGIRVSGELSDPDPIQAIADALDEFPADEILLVERAAAALALAAPERHRPRTTGLRATDHTRRHASRIREAREMNILVTAASQQGATQGIAEAIGRTLRGRGLDTTVAQADEVVDVAAYDAFVIGSAVYVGHWLEPATEFCRAGLRPRWRGDRSGSSPADQWETQGASSSRR